MALKQHLQQKLGLKINPLQIQLIKLLELPAYQLEQRVKEELETNPLLEEGSEEEATDEYKEAGDDMYAGEEENGEEDVRQEDNDFSFEDYIPDDDDIPDYKLYTSNASRDNDSKDFVFSQDVTFRENLLDQLGMRDLTDFQKKIAEYIIGNIDDDGYLRRDIENIVDDLAFGAGIEVTVDEVERLLKIIQEFEPYGVGARNLKECLLLQIDHKQGEVSGAVLDNARLILEECFEEFSKNTMKR